MLDECGREIDCAYSRFKHKQPANWPGLIVSSGENSLPLSWSSTNPWQPTTTEVIRTSTASKSPVEALSPSIHSSWSSSSLCSSYWQCFVIFELLCFVRGHPLYLEHSIGRSRLHHPKPSRIHPPQFLRNLTSSMLSLKNQASLLKSLVRKSKLPKKQWERFKM